MPFREVIRPPLWLLLFIAFLFASLVFSIWAAFDLRATLVSSGICLALFLFVALRLPMVISVDSELKIDEAHLEKKYIKSVEVLDENQMQKLRTRDADPAAFLAFRFWLSRGIKVTLNDPRDPTPYWLVSCKKGEELKRALES